MSEQELLAEKVGAVGLITLNRPKALNALNLNMCQLMRPVLEEWEQDDTVTAIVVQGAGDRAFCAGGDIRALHDSGKEGTPYAIDFYGTEYRLNAYIFHYPKPYVALVDGITMGGGVGLSVHGDHRVVTERTLFAMPETGIGLYPDVGGSYFLPRCPGQLGMYLGLTGERLKMADTLYVGVGTAFTPSEKLPGLIDQMSSGVAPEEAISSVSEETEIAPLTEHREKIDHFFAKRSVEEIIEALEAEDDAWAQKTAEAMKSKSPTSQKLTYRQICEGATRDFDDCMRMEFRMTNRVVEGVDFYEGVRAAIIDKDQSPKWNPGTLAEVTSDAIDAYFQTLGDRELQLP